MGEDTLVEIRIFPREKDNCPASFGAGNDRVAARPRDAGFLVVTGRSRFGIVAGDAQGGVLAGGCRVLTNIMQVRGSSLITRFKSKYSFTCCQYILNMHCTIR